MGEGRRQGDKAEGENEEGRGGEKGWSGLRRAPGCQSGPGGRGVLGAFRLFLSGLRPAGGPGREGRGGTAGRGGRDGRKRRAR